MTKRERRPGDPEAASNTTRQVDSTEIIRCKECSKPLTAPKTVKRRLCRSCWRVHRILVGGGFR